MTRTAGAYAGAAILLGLFAAAPAVLSDYWTTLLEAFASFWASAFKEVIVFTLIIPVLLWLSLRTRHDEEEE